jgi:hypothetical protein
LLQLCRQLRHFKQHEDHRQKQQENRRHSIRKLRQQAGDKGHGSIGRYTSAAPQPTPQYPRVAARVQFAAAELPVMNGI